MVTPPLLHNLQSVPEAPPVIPHVSYGGVCPDTGEFLEIHPSTQAVTEANALMNYLRTLRGAGAAFSTEHLYKPHVGKMFGVLICETVAGERGCLRAFSGMYQRAWTIEGFVPPTAQVENFDALRLETEAEVKRLTDDIKRLEKLSPAPGREQAIGNLKLERKKLSWHLTDEIHAAYALRNVRGEERSLLRVWGQSGRPPTGMGDCCAPKLLQYASIHALKPLALAEFWWGAPPPVHPRIEGEFYSACEHKCHPILGFMLQGLSNG